VACHGSPRKQQQQQQQQQQLGFVSHYESSVYAVESVTIAVYQILSKCRVTLPWIMNAELQAPLCISLWPSCQEHKRKEGNQISADECQTIRNFLCTWG
jgi:hypothetical protein